MKYRIITLVLVLIIAAFATACVSKSDYEVLLANYTDLTEEKDALNQQIGQYEEEIEVKNSETEALKSDIASRIDENEVLKEQLAEAEGQLDFTELENETLRQKDSVLAYEALEQENTALEEDVLSLKGDISNLNVQIKKLNVGIEEYKELDLYKDIWSSSVFSGIQPYYSGIKLVNNSAATDPSYKELISFIKADKTDRKDYIWDVYMCGDFAEDVHNNAERAGIKAGLVGIQFEEGPGHACNVFKTTDKGLIFIDCTGLEAGQSGPSSCDTRVTVRVDYKYRPKPIVDTGWRWDSMGEVVWVEIYW